MHTGLRSFRRSLLLATVVAAVVAPAAQAFYVKGHQIPNGNSGSKYFMTGGLNGKWKITKFHVKQQHHDGLIKIKGQEKFNGCVDVARDGDCAGDPDGKLFFRFRYWVQVSQDGESQLLGACAHRVVASSGGLAGTTGFLMMVDTPAPNEQFGIKTHYEGEITPPGYAKPHAAKPHC